MAEVNRIEKYAEWLVQNKDKQGTPEFATVAEAYKTMRSEASAPTQADAEVDTSLSGAVSYGVDQAGAMVGKGIQSTGELTGLESVENYGQEMAQRNEAEMAASNYQRPEGADGIISNLREGDLANAGKSLAYGVAEAAPQVAGGAAASIGAGLAATSAPIIGTGLAIGGTAYGVTNALGANRAEKEEQGLDPTATATDLASAVASGLVELTPLKGGGATLKFLREGVQEGVQEGLVIGGTAVQGGEYVPQEVLERMGDAALIGGTASKGISSVVNTVTKTGEIVFKPKEDLDPETTQAASDVSTLLQRVADENGYNLKDIDSSSKKGANQTLEGARDVLLKDLESQVISLTEKGQIKALSPEDKAFFKQAIRQSKGKVGTTVTKENFDFMQDRFGNTREGQALLNTFRRSNVLTEVYAGGLKGGVSKFTDMFNPLPSIGRAYNPAGMVAGNINTGAALATGGGSLAAQIPLVVGGRAIDAVTGRRSKVNRFVKKNRKGDGLSDPTAPAARDLKQEAKDRRAAEAALRNQPDPEVERQKAEKAQQKADAERRKFEEGQKKQFLDEEEAKRNAQQYANGEPPLPNSPRGTVHSAIIETYGPQGRTVAELDADIMKALDDVLANPNTTAERKRAIRAYKQSLATGKSIMDGSPLNDVTSLIRSKNLNFESKKPKKGQKPIEPQLPIERQLGKNSNQAYLATLRDKMDNDKSILAEDRATLVDAFDSMALNLGKDPVASLEAIVSRATSNLMKPKLAETHLTPYMERVKQQQKAKDVPPVPPAPSPSGPDGPTVAGTVSPSGPVDSGQPTQPALAQQPEPPKVAPLDAEPTKPKKVKKPTAKSVKKAMPEAKAIIEIGRKGSKYENGIQDVDQALEVARLLGITARMMNSGTALQKATGSPRGTAAVHQWSPSNKGFGSSVFFVKPGGSIFGNKITSTTSLMTALHEMGHALTQGNMDGKGMFGMGTVKNPFSGQLDQVGKNSYNTSVMKPILEGLGKDHPAIKEIQAFQEAGKGFTESNPSETVPAREFGEIMHLLNNAQSPQLAANYKAHMERYRRYTNKTAELSVDPMWLYLMNPRLAKELMPINTKLIRDEFKKANNGKIQFYSHPFATLVAVVSAMGLLAAGSEEDEEPMMAPGILSA